MSNQSASEYWREQAENIAKATYLKAEMKALRADMPVVGILTTADETFHKWEVFVARVNSIQKHLKEGPKK